MNSETIEKQRKTFPEPSKIKPGALWDTKRPSGIGRISWIRSAVILLIPLSGVSGIRSLVIWIAGLVELAELRARN